MAERYECDLCGACCKSMMIELCDIDLAREPQLRPLGRPCNVAITSKAADGRETEVAKYQALALVTDGPDGACRFLGAENRCGIYPTRPGSCVKLAAGGEQCQKERVKVGLPPLMPVADPVAA